MNPSSHILEQIFRPLLPSFQQVCFMSVPMFLLSSRYLDVFPALPLSSSFHANTTILHNHYPASSSVAYQSTPRSLILLKPWKWVPWYSSLRPSYQDPPDEHISHPMRICGIRNVLNARITMELSYSVHPVRRRSPASTAWGITCHSLTREAAE